MKPVANTVWSEGYAFHTFLVETTMVDFPYSRQSTASGSKGCNIATMWTPYAQETLVNGVLQGRKQTDPRGASLLSKNQIWNTFIKLQFTSNVQERDNVNAMRKYQDLKKSDFLRVRREAKIKAKEEALKGWGGGSDQG